MKLYNLNLTINMFAFLYLNANSIEICEEIFFLPFSENWCQHFCWDSRLIYLAKNVWVPHIFFVDSNSPCKDLHFPCGRHLGQNPLNLVGTVLNYRLLKSAIWKQHLPKIWKRQRTLCSSKHFQNQKVKLFRFYNRPAKNFIFGFLATHSNLIYMPQVKNMTWCKTLVQNIVSNLCKPADKCECTGNLALSQNWWKLPEYNRPF